jgi:hypothetical protein
MLTMTEPFASAVAAVAPVLVLIGVVEFNLWGRKVNDLSSEHADLLERSVAIIPADSSGDVERARREINALAADAPQPKNPMGAMLMLGAWAIWATLQGRAFTLAMGWLGTPDAGPRADDARFCFSALGFGLFWVVMVPMAQFVTSHLRVKRRARMARRQLAVFLEATDNAHEPDQEL